MSATWASHASPLMHFRLGLWGLKLSIAMVFFLSIFIGATKQSSDVWRSHDNDLFALFIANAGVVADIAATYPDPGWQRSSNIAAIRTTPSLHHKVYLSRLCAGNVPEESVQRSLGILAHP
ncbi:hypothetical protein QBC36DRAFT_310956 [Triangularia setosa]|uniref:Uncharacterized protein n=1 Tax=Triangularia setosa TaxID=2587417 RepID=A0AAN6W8V0_9PEZI|nr:hypothetical protein QBC36DRAFT_310956 [Podospora setosa]